MDVPGAGRGGDVICGLRIFRIAHIDDRKTLGEHVTDAGEAEMHHHLHAIGTAALIGVPDQLHVASVVGFRLIAHLYASKKFGTAIQSIITSSFCSSACMRRPSSVLRFTPMCVPSLRLCMTMVLPTGWR